MYASEPEDVKLTERVFNSYCVSCHTVEEKVKHFDGSKEDSVLIAKIRSGDTGMPTYSWLFTDEDLERLIRHMRKINSEER